MSPSSASSSSGPGRRHRLRGAAAAALSKPRAKAGGKALDANDLASPWSEPVPKRPRTSTSTSATGSWKWGSTKRRSTRSRTLQELPPKAPDDLCRDQLLPPQRTGWLPLEQVYAKTSLMARNCLKDNATACPAGGGVAQGCCGGASGGGGGAAAAVSWRPSHLDQQSEQVTFRNFQWTTDSPPQSSTFQLETSAPRKRKHTKSSIISGRHADAQAERRQQEHPAVLKEQEQRPVLEQLQPPLLEEQPPLAVFEQQQQLAPWEQQPIVERPAFPSGLEQPRSCRQKFIDKLGDPANWTASNHGPQICHSAYHTVNLAFVQYDGAPARQPVRRSLTFDEHTSPVYSLAGSVDQGSAVRRPFAPATPQKNPQPSRTLSSSPTPPLSLGYGGLHSKSPPTPLSASGNVLPLHALQQHQGLFEAVQAETVHLQQKSSNPDAAPFDLNSVPTPERKPPRRKYTPKVAKERKVKVSKVPKPTPTGDQVRRRPGRPRKEQQTHREPEQELSLAWQEQVLQCIPTDGVAGNQGVECIIDFVNKNTKSGRKTMEYGATKQQAKPSRRKSKAKEVIHQSHPQECSCRECWAHVISNADAHQANYSSNVNQSTRRVWPKPMQPNPSNSDRTVYDNVRESGLQQSAHLCLTPIAVREAASQKAFSIPDFSSMQAEQGLVAWSADEGSTHAEPLCIDQRDKQFVPFELPLLESEPTELTEASGCTDDNKLALVPHNGATDIIVYQGPLMKKKKSRAKVVLDESTLRCWNLLMGKRQPETIDQDGIQSRKWDEERRDMKRRVDRFLHRTHQVQGDHTFSLWKGSIVDSVVGAFLTQNVSDQLSSSAFMALAARYPVGGLSKARTSDEDKAVVHNEGVDQFKLHNKAGNGATPLHLEQQVPTPIGFIAIDTHSVEAEGNGWSHCQTQISDYGHAQDFQILERLSEDKNNNLESATVMELCALSQAAVSVNNSLASINEGNGACSSSKILDTGSDGEECRMYSPRQLADECASSIPNQVKVNCAEVSTGCLGIVDTVSEASPTSFILCIDLNHRSFDSQGFCSSFEEVPATVSPPQLEAESSTASVDRLPLDRTGLRHHDAANGEKNYPPTTNMSSCSTAVNCAVAKWRTNLSQQDERMSDVCNYAGVHPLQIASISPSRSAIQDSVVEGEPLMQDVNKRKPRKGYGHLSGLERAHLEAQQGGLSRSKIDWEGMRVKVVVEEAERTPERGSVMDAVDWEAVRVAKLDEIAGVIKERGMNYMLAGRISAFLDRIHTEHGRIDLEWLRDIPADSAKEFLLSIRGLGLKSVECIRLLTLHHLAFPVDTNVGRICVRLGWVPLEPLPEELQLHLLELYPVQATIQQYLWPRLCTLDQHTLYELHYQLITFGKVFCTKSRPNCQACPMSSDCRHYASSSSAKLLLKGPEGDTGTKEMARLEWVGSNVAGLLTESLSAPKFTVDGAEEATWRPQFCEPIIEEPTTPEPVNPPDTYSSDIEDMFDWSGGAGLLNPGVTSIQCHLQHEPNLGEVVDNVEHLFLHSSNPQSLSTREENDHYSVLGADITHDRACASVLSLVHATDTAEDVSERLNLTSGATSDFRLEQLDKLQSLSGVVSSSSRELVVIPPEVAARPPTQLKRYGRLRTVHNVYEIPDNHPILREVEPRDALDPYVYLLAIWGPGDGLQSTAIPSLATSDECIDRDMETVKGTLLIPCRTALKGTFPLNGTYFQKNEVFADHCSSVEPLTVPRTLLWNLRRRLVYFGTTATNIYRNLTMEEIQACGWAACVCVRGFERSTRAPKPLAGRLHFPASKLQAQKRAAKKNVGSALKSPEFECTTMSVVR